VARIKPFPARHGVQDDLRVPARQLDELVDEGLAQPAALVAGQDRNVADVRAIRTVGQCAARRHEHAVLVGEAAEHAVREHRLQPLGRLLAQRRLAVQVGQFVPVDGVEGIGPGDGHVASVTSLIGCQL
jgi:hypothetical protein